MCQHHCSRSPGSDLRVWTAASGRWIDWSITDPQGRPLDVFSFRMWVGRHTAALNRQATVHGDVHLRNILVRDDREPHFIDYAYSGPGHPCFDLVRLACAVLFRCFRPTADECDVARLFHDVLRGGNEDALIQSNPRLTASVGNRLAVKTLAKCRRASIRGCAALQCYRFRLLLRTVRHRLPILALSAPPDHSRQKHALRPRDVAARGGYRQDQ